MLEALKDPGYVTEILQKNLCPQCKAGEPLVNAEKTRILCQICALRCVRLSHTLWGAETPPPPKPKKSLAWWFREVLDYYGLQPEGKSWIKLAHTGNYIHHWRLGLSVWETVIHHKVMDLRREKKFVEEVYEKNWPFGLLHGYDYASIEELKKEARTAPLEKEKSDG